MILGAFVNVLDYGAKGDGINDDTSAIQAAITYAAPLGKIVFCPAGTYKITSTLVKASGFYGLNLIGEGGYKTIFSYPTIGATPCLKIIGGSGSISNSKIEGITFNGASTTQAIMIDGQGGQLIIDCDFGANAIGGLLNNYSVGSFAEYCVFERCNFSENCIEALVYLRTNGDDSFNGSGLRNCTISEAIGATLPKIRIGGLGGTSNNILVYNAPLSFQIWKNTITPVLINNTTRFTTCFHGNITLELFSGGSSSNWTFANDNYNSYLLGSLMIGSGGPSVLGGSLILCTSFEVSVTGTVNAPRKTYKVPAIAMINGANTLITLPVVTDESYLVRVSFNDFAAPGSVKAYILAICFARSSNGVSTLAQPIDFFGGSMATPVFSISGTSLIATASFLTSVYCNTTITQIGHGSDFNL